MQRLAPLGYHSVYKRNWRVLGAIWVLFALSSTVLQILVLIHPGWLGSAEGGHFGLYDFCLSDDCAWQMFRIRPLAREFQVAALLVLAATVLSMLAVLSILLLVLLRDRYVFLLCSWMHMFSFFAMLAGCLVYPAGWEHPRVREVCDSARYQPGLCTVRWPYVLAFVLVVDQLALSSLGFVLACKQPPSIPELHCYGGPSQLNTAVRAAPPRRKSSVQESYYSKSSSRLHL